MVCLVIVGVEMKRLFGDCRAGIAVDIFIGLVFVFFAIFVLVISYTVWVNWDAQIQVIDVGDANVKAIISSMGDWFFLLDKAIPFVFLVLWGGAIMSSLLVRPDHPFFFIVSLVLLSILTIGSFVFVDWGTTLFENPVLLATSSALSNSMFFVNNFHWISFFVMFASTVWFYIKDSFGLTSGGGGIPP
jgi:hypothetical protein